MLLNPKFHTQNILPALQQLWSAKVSIISSRMRPIPHLFYELIIQILCEHAFCPYHVSNTLIRSQFCTAAVAYAKLCPDLMCTLHIKAVSIFTILAYTFFANGSLNAWQDTTIPRVPVFCHLSCEKSHYVRLPVIDGRSNLHVTIDNRETATRK